MKISKLTKLTGYSRNTIQYYTCIGLLMPLQKGADHDYTQREVDDLAYIEKLKAMSFSIMEDSMILLILTGTYTKECQMNSISIFTRLLTVMFKH